MLNSSNMTLEFIRLDLSISTSGTTDLATRRQAAVDVLQTLVSSGYEADARGCPD
jgi:hypothetical protein